jgi:hypothetical protein
MAHEPEHVKNVMYRLKNAVCGWKQVEDATEKRTNAGAVHRCTNQYVWALFHTANPPVISVPELAEG